MKRKETKQNAIHNQTMVNYKWINVLESKQRRINNGYIIIQLKR